MFVTRNSMMLKCPMSCEGLHVSVSAFMEQGVVMKGWEGCEVVLDVRV